MKSSVKSWSVAVIAVAILPTLVKDVISIGFFEPVIVVKFPVANPCAVVVVTVTVDPERVIELIAIVSENISVNKGKNNLSC